MQPNALALNIMYTEKEAGGIIRYSNKADFKVTYVVGGAYHDVDTGASFIE